VEKEIARAGGKETHVRPQRTLASLRKGSSAHLGGEGNGISDSGGD